MSIAAACPHCETVYDLQPDLVGRAMRCPNPECREVFEVRPMAASAAAAPVAAPPTTVAVAPAGLLTPTPFVVPTPSVAAVVVTVLPPVKEVVWTPGADLPPPPAARPKQPKVKSAKEPEGIVAPRRRRKNRAPLALAVLGVLTVLVAGVGAVYAVRYQALAEERLAAAAKAEYDRGNFAAAAKSYAALAGQYPESGKIETYRFFSDLAAMRLALGSVTTREDPGPAGDALRAFVESRKDSPLAKPETGYGRDVLEAGKKLGEDVVGHADDRVKAFRGDRTKADDLRRAEETVAAGRALAPLLAPFRAKDDPPLDALAAGLDRVQAEIDRERKRLGVLARVSATLREPTDQAVAEAKAELVAAGLADDAEAVERIRTAEGDFLRRVRYDRDPATPRAAPPAGASSFAFAAPVGATKPASRGELDDPPAVFLAVAAGVLYALDEDTGDPLWAARLGPDVFDPPAVARVGLADGPTDLAVVVSNVGGKPAVAGHVVRTGSVRWYQELPAPAVGAVAVANGRAFVPVRDAAGTVLVFDIATGARVGRITLGQPAGPVVVRPGTGDLYAAAESRRVFVFRTDAGDDDGAAARCVRVIPTGHPPGTLRTPPVILGPPGEDPAARWLVLNQADGPTASKLRAFPLPPDAPAAATDPPRLDPIAPAVELPLPGWAWFPPVSDGERFGVVTDAGQFRLFGVNQPGTDDPAVFQLPHPPLPPSPDGAPTPGLVVPAEEGAFWVVAGGRLQKFLLNLAADRGLALVPAGAGVPIGTPTQPAQLNPSRETACFVVRSPNSSGCRAVAVRMHDGEPRWQRQLGVVPATTPIPSDTGVLVIGEDGGVVSVLAGAAPPGGVTIAARESVVATPPDPPAGLTAVAVSADGKTVFAVTPTRVGEVARWAVRRVANGKVEHAGTVTAPAALAGAPAVLGDTLLLPAADGFVYRLTPGDGRVRADTLAQGPRWHTDRRPADPTCFTAVVSADTFVTSDGGRVLTRWAWPVGGAWADGGAKWELRERVAARPLVVPGTSGRAGRLLVADATGGLWLYALDRADRPPRRWVPGRTASLPAGKVADGFAVRTDAAGRHSVCYAANGRQLVCLDLDRDDPHWVVSLPGGASAAGIVGSPQPAPGGHWLVTDLAGNVTLHDGETGKALATRPVAPPGTVPAAASVVGTDGRVVVALSDGTVAIVAVPPTAPAPKSKE